jgi:hypothetical protein
MGANSSVYGESPSGAAAAAAAAAAVAPGNGQSPQQQQDGRPQPTIRDRVLKMPVKERQECELYKILKQSEGRAHSAGPLGAEDGSGGELGGRAASAALQDHRNGVSDGSSLTQHHPSTDSLHLGPKKKFLERNRSTVSFSTTASPSPPAGDAAETTATLPAPPRSRSSSLSIQQQQQQKVGQGQGQRRMVDMRSCIDAILESELMTKTSSPVPSLLPALPPLLTATAGSKRPASRDAPLLHGSLPDSRLLGLVEEEKMLAAIASVNRGRLSSPTVLADLQRAGLLVDARGAGSSDEPPAKRLARRDFVPMSRADLDRLSYPTAVTSSLELGPELAHRDKTSNVASTDAAFNSAYHQQQQRHMRGSMMPTAVPSGGSIVTGQAPNRVSY